MELDPTFASAYALAVYCRAQRLALADREGEAAEIERLAKRAARLGVDDAMALSASALALFIASHDFDVQRRVGGARFDAQPQRAPRLDCEWRCEATQRRARVGNCTFRVRNAAQSVRSICHRHVEGDCPGSFVGKSL
jgi:hypothetical protein